MAEQGGDREPVGQAADHRCLGKGPDEPDRGMDRTDRAGGEEGRRHQHQQPGRDPAHPAQARRDGFPVTR